MSNDDSGAKAKVGRTRRIQSIWLVPVVALLIGVWMVYANWANRGPTIEITFSSGEGIEPGQTKVKRRNVEVGDVVGMRLTDDAQRVVLAVQVNKEYEDLLREDTQFWVVRPRVGLGGISGLGTLISGAYVEMSRGIAVESARSFVGLERPPVTPIGTPGLHVTLSSEGGRALVEGQPVLFHGQRVGRIEFVNFDTNERRTYYDAFIAAPFDELITTNTRFWFASGFAVDLSADGLRVETASLESIIEGGVSFDVPQGQPLGEPVTARAFYTIYPNANSINEPQYVQSLRFVLMIEDSIRGLRPGAPVEYRGVKIGQVLRTDIDYPEVTNLLAEDSRIPVLISITPALLGFEDTESALGRAEGRIVAMIEEGLHAELATGNLLTGRKYVELTDLAIPGTERQLFGDYRVIPTATGQVGRLIESVAATADKLSELPLDDMVASAREALEQMRTTLADMEEVLDEEGSRELLSNLNDTLTSFRELAADFAAGSETNEDLRRALSSLEITLNDLQPVLRQLRNKPNSLIFGADDVEDREPRGGQQ